MLGCISQQMGFEYQVIEECFAKDVFIDEDSMNGAIPRFHGNRNGAFTGIKAILRISGRNIDALKNVIKAGKGEIIEASSPYSSCSQSSTASHCFVDVKKVSLKSGRLRFLKNHESFVLSQMYINAFLMNGADVDMSKYEINM
ncbi:hypothetical protein CVS40_5267 [Lucilia cuprina]|nr:hypothetical protein CVS40_5267 [Lucilia cuprina]